MYGRKFFSFFILSSFIALLSSCNNSNNNVSVKRVVNGKIVEDTSAYRIPAFTFITHLGDTLTEKEVAGKYIVVDFFFIQCPSICPKMKAQMLRVNERFGTRNDFVILSHTIDPKRDSAEALNAYAKKLGIEKNWQFLTGEKDSLFAAADKYLISAEEDPESPGGFAHSGTFILADKNGLIRGYYDGTNETSVDKLIRDLEKLFKAEK